MYQVYIDPYTVKVNCCFDIKIVTLLAQVKIIDTQMPLRNDDYKITSNSQTIVVLARSSLLELSLKNDAFKFKPQTTVPH